MDLFFKVRQYVLDELDSMVAAGELPSNLDTSGVTVEPPRDPLHGDMATNAAMVLAKVAKKTQGKLRKSWQSGWLLWTLLIVQKLQVPGF